MTRRRRSPERDALIETVERRLETEKFVELKGIPNPRQMRNRLKKSVSRRGIHWLTTCFENSIFIRRG